MYNKLNVLEKEGKLTMKESNENPVLAICYDFDKTLSPTDMQAQGYIQSVGYDVDKFWKESNKLAEDNEMDDNLAYMYMMMKQSEGNFVFNEKVLNEYGSKVVLFKGVRNWFTRINKFGKENGVNVEHYIISSGLKEMIEGTKIAKYFKKIYASSFYYNDRGVAVWPAQAVNYTNKTQFLFRIEKGVLDINDRSVNDYFPPSKIRVPFRNMVYIGDSDTDIPCMKLVNANGGHSIGVYNPDKKDKSKVYKMINENRIKYFESADYSENSGIDLLIKQIILKTAENEKLEQLHYRREEETQKYFKSLSDEDAEKDSLINELDDSKNFKNTHQIVKKLSKYPKWTENQVNKLINIALNNHPVRYILTDKDIKRFYNDVIAFSKENHLVDKLREYLDEEK